MVWVFEYNLSFIFIMHTKFIIIYITCYLTLEKLHTYMFISVYSINIFVFILFSIYNLALSCHKIIRFRCFKIFKNFSTCINILLILRNAFTEYYHIIEGYFTFLKQKVLFKFFILAFCIFLDIVRVCIGGKFII